MISYQEKPDQRRYPRILIISIFKIGKSDKNNNNLLLRSIIGDEWPKVNLAQIYTSEEPNSIPFCNHSYKVSSHDRILGRLFVRFKSGFDNRSQSSTNDLYKPKPTNFAKIKNYTRSLLVNTGLYELIFRLRVSSQMLQFVNEFKPDAILAQGYSIGMCSIPLRLSKVFNIPIILFYSDDWPSYQYNSMHGEPNIFRPFVRPVLSKLANQLIEAASVLFAFGPAMHEIFKKRYMRDSIILYHCDDPARFDSKFNINDKDDVLTVLTMGTFNHYRTAALSDVVESCIRLSKNIERKVNLKIVTSCVTRELLEVINNFDFISVVPDPGHEELPRLLSTADIMLIVEGFDLSYINAIKLSISSKSHLFMYAGKPIVLYAHPDSGVAKYCDSFGWGLIVREKSVDLLVSAFQSAINIDIKQKIVSAAKRTANSFHNCNTVRERFRQEILWVVNENSNC